MQGFAFKWLKKTQWPPPVRSVVTKGVLLCIALGVPLGALLYDSQRKGQCAQSDRERRRTEGIVRAMLKPEEKGDAKIARAKEKDHVACARIWTAIKAARESGAGPAEIRVWLRELAHRIAAAMRGALEQEPRDIEAIEALLKVLREAPECSPDLDASLTRRLRALVLGRFRRRLRTIWHLIVKPARTQLKWIFAAIVVATGGAIVNTLGTTYFLRALHAARTGKNNTELRRALGATLVIHVLQILVDILQQQCATRGAGEISLQIQKRVFERLLTADCSLVGYQVSEKLFLLREAAALDKKLLKLPFDLLTTVVSLTARYFTLGRISARLLLTVGVLVPLCSWFSTRAQLWVSRQRDSLRRSAERRRECDARILGPQFLTVRSFVQERTEAKSFELFLRHKVREESKATVLSALASLAHLLPLAAQLGAILYGSKLIKMGWLTVPQLDEFIEAHDIAIVDLTKLRDNIPALWTAVEPAARIVNLLNSPRNIERPLADPVSEPSWAAQNPSSPGEYPPIAVAFKNVSFSYPTYPDVKVLRDVSFEIKAGVKVAIVGESGSGKSTVLALIQRFYDIDEGQILIDGRDIKEYDPRWLRQRIAVVSQRCVVFPRDVTSNICLGNNGDSGSNVKTAAKAAKAAAFIESLPEGYDTQLGEGGIELSGGQQQRIAIARAIQKRPSLFLLDEAFANLDASSEASVLDTLKALVEKRPQTVVTVAHQLSTIAWSDTIVYMDKGSVKEIGTHKELMMKKGHYYSMFTRQMRSAGVVDKVKSCGTALPTMRRGLSVPVLRRGHSDVLSLNDEVDKSV